MRTETQQRVGRSNGWDRFWFGPQSTATVALVRVAFGLVATAWTVALAPDLF